MAGCGHAALRHDHPLRRRPAPRPARAGSRSWPTSATPTCGRRRPTAPTASRRWPWRRCGRRRCAWAPPSSPPSPAARRCLAQCVASLADAAPGRLAFGIGTSSNVIVERLERHRLRRARTSRTRDMVRFLRAALDRREGQGGLRHLLGATASSSGVVPEQPVPILIAALREGMLRLAGREGDGAIINWLSADDVSTVAPIVQAPATARQGDGGPHLRGPHRRRRHRPRAWAASPSPPTSTCPCTPPSTTGWAGASCSPTCGTRGRRATARPPSPPSPTRWSTSSSSTARPRSAASTSSATWTTASPPRPWPSCPSASTRARPSATWPPR